MTRKTALAAFTALTLTAIAGAGAARAELKDEAQVQEQLINIGIAYRIDERCDSISKRTVRGLAALLAVKDTARSLGYSSAQIDAYVDDKVEKARLISVAEARLRDMGAVEGQPDTFCTVGQAEIAAGSAIGRLLR